MFYSTIAIAVFLIVAVPTCTQARAYYDEEDKLCKTDILLVLDSSRSIGTELFNRHIKPFLEKLVDRVTIGKNDEQLSIITFSSKQNTMLFDKIQFPGKGEPAQTKSKLRKIIRGLEFKELNPGEQDRTFTGKALQLAFEKIFTKKSPLGARPDAQDVIILLTDGQPNAARYRDTKQQIRDSESYAKKFRKNGVRIISIAVEKEGQNNKSFRKFVESLANKKSDYFDARLDNLSPIIEELVRKARTCNEIKPGYCKCSNSRTTRYIESGKTIEVSWPAPQFTCNEGKEVIPGDDVVQTPNIPNPSRFPVGTHDVMYSYTIITDEESYTESCVVTIDVIGCKCTKVSAVQAPLLKVGESTVKATWDVPKPTCDLENKKYGFRGEGYFPYGKNTKNYVYSLKNGESSLTCSIKVDITAVPCAGKNYNPTTEECCCGEVHDQKNNHECCGTSYINIASSKCCPNDNVARRHERCPGD